MTITNILVLPPRRAVVRARPKVLELGGEFLEPTTATGETGRKRKRTVPVPITWIPSEKFTVPVQTPENTSYPTPPHDKQNASIRVVRLDCAA